MHSAARVFGRRGLEHASVDEIAEDAGFTKGAFYANFASKEEIFLAMLDERFAERLAEIERIDRERRGRRRSRRGRPAPTSRTTCAPTREWQRLFFEFAAYAARDERVPRRAGEALPRCSRSGSPTSTGAGSNGSASSRRSRSSTCPR